MSEVKRTERGWPGHFISADKCLFRRNTLLENATCKVIVSTVGNYRVNNHIEPIGYNNHPRYYETLVFEAVLIGAYYDIATDKPISFYSPWAICAESVDKLPNDVDNQADIMHETVVEELILKLKSS